MSLRLPSSTRSRSSFRQSSRDRPNKLTKSRSCSRGPSSRDPSPARLGRRNSRLDLYMAKSSRRNSFVQLSQETEYVPTGLYAKEIKRWDGIQRMTGRWDALRRDNEIWLPTGDCLVHFYEKGSSRRGASLRVFLADIESSDCRPFMNTYQVELLDPALQPTQQPDRTSRFSAYFDDISICPQYEIFVPAPNHLSKEEALQHHLTTRNFFAWMYNRPLVGDRLGQALIRLQDRMDQYRPNTKDNQAELLAYFEDQGYMDFRHCPDHALAMLQFAEHYKLKDLWTDAFVHCSGMHDELDASCEFENVSRASQALITRAHIEMDIRLERAGRSLEEFLEDEIPGSDFNLGKQARLYLERFRSFLQCYYIGRYGYWPPALNRASSDALPKPVYQSMYVDLRNLYEYLADKRSEHEVRPDQLAEICTGTLLELSNFDKKNKYTPLPNSLPLVPKIPDSPHRRKSIWSIFTYGLAKKERRLAAFAALKSATNHDDNRVMSSNIVREYLRFERDWTMIEDPGASCADARRARWILIYAMLQTLISVAKVPDAVRDTEGVSYPLCCQTAGTPPWDPTKSEKPAEPSEPTTPATTITDLVNDYARLAPSPLKIPQSIVDTPRQRLSGATPTPTLKAPQPLRSSSIELLHNVAASHSFLQIPSPATPPTQPQRPSSFRAHSFTTLSPLDTTIHSPSPPITLSPPPHDPTTPETPTSRRSSSNDPSTPATSEKGGWSASSTSGSDEDGMEHRSVVGVESDGNEGDDEDDEEVPMPKSPSLALKSSAPKAPLRQHKALLDVKGGVDRTPSVGSMRRINPEVEAFLMA